MNSHALDRLKAMRDGLDPLPPLYQTLGISVLFAELGSVAMQLLPASAHGNPHGFVGRGVIATILDTATAWACDTACEPGDNCVTIDLNVNFHRPVNVDDSPLTATATLVHSGTRWHMLPWQLPRASSWRQLLRHAWWLALGTFQFGLARGTTLLGCVRHASRFE